MLLGDLLTLHQLNLPVKIVVFRNDSLDFVELEMKAGGFLDFAVELKNPDFAALAESAGILGLKAETRRMCGRCYRKHSSTTGRRWSKRSSIARNFRCRQRSPSNKPPASGCSCSKR